MAVAFRQPLLWVFQLVANLVLFGLFAGWLRIPVATTWQLTLNGLLAFVIVFGVIAVHAGTMNYFSDTSRMENPKLVGSLRRAVRHIVAIGVCALAFYLCLHLVNKAEFYQPQFPAYIRSHLPVSIRRHLSMEFLVSIYDWAIFAARWIVIPGRVLPFVVRTADLGFRAFGSSGFSAWRRAMSSGSYWVVLVGFVFVGIVGTHKIMNWTPDFKTSTLRYESISLALRLTIAYFLGVCSWMLMCSMLGRLGSGQRDAR